MRLTAASFLHLLTLSARCENLYGASELPPTQFIRYRDPYRCILRIFHPHRRLRRRSFYNRSIRTPFLLPGATANVSRNSLTTKAGTEEATSFVDFADVITLRAHTSHQMGNFAFKLSSLSRPCRPETRSGEGI